MRKSSSYAELMPQQRKTSNSQLSSSISSSKLTLNHSALTANGLRPAKGFSFGSSPRNSLIALNVSSPAAKYNIKGLVEINLAKRKGPTMGGGRETSVEKTTLSYIASNSNPGPGNYKLQSTNKHTTSIKIGKQNNQALQVGFLNEKAISNTPGPGAYQAKVVKLKGGKMPTQGSRFTSSNKQNQPGPGSYNTIYIDQDVVSKGNSRVQSRVIKLI